jgi:hypothetical protein
MIWACFSHLGIANVVDLPPQDSFTRAFFVEKTWTIAMKRSLIVGQVFAQVALSSILTTLLPSGA